MIDFMPYSKNSNEKLLKKPFSIANPKSNAYLLNRCFVLGWYFNIVDIRDNMVTLAPKSISIIGSEFRVYYTNSREIYASFRLESIRDIVLFQDGVVNNSVKILVREFEVVE